MINRHSLIVSLPGQDPVLRSSVLIPNEPACYGCHSYTQPYLGVLIADFSLQELERDAAGHLQANLMLSAGATMLITFGVYALIHVLIVRRVERFQMPLRQFALGDFSARVPLPAGDDDELGALARAVNQMAKGLSQKAEVERQARQVRHRAIMEERNRLARELHDGMAQVLGYVQTKALAVRLHLARSQLA